MSIESKTQTNQLAAEALKSSSRPLSAVASTTTLTPAIIAEIKDAAHTVYINERVDVPTAYIQATLNYLVKHSTKVEGESK